MKRVLVCIDGSPYSQTVCQLAAWWACCTGAGLKLIYVSDRRSLASSLGVDISGSLGVQPYQGVIAQMQRVEEEKASMLKQLGERLFNENEIDLKDVEFEHSSGFLVDIIERSQSDFAAIFIGKRGEDADYAKGHLGSMVERVVRKATLPVFISARSHRVPRRVLIAFDGSEYARKALDFVATHAQFRGLELYLITVAEDHDSEHYAGILREAEDLFRSSQRAAVFQILGGEPEDTIATFVDEKGIDLVIMGAYGHSRARHFFVGSTTSEMIRRCKVPILCFR